MAQVTGPAPSDAQSTLPPPHPPTQARPKAEVSGFDRLDIDSDGRISKGEAGGDIQLVQQFAKVDRDGDGYISAAEYEAYRKAAGKD